MECLSCIARRTCTFAGVCKQKQMTEKYYILTLCWNFKFKTHEHLFLVTILNLPLYMEHFL